jgi:multidrug efflux pump subunit AcrA (membrane-fusion protein)
MNPDSAPPGSVPPPADALLARARAAWRDVPAATALLAEALATAPHCLPLHYARYKFHSSHGQYALAEAAARAALAEAARQAGLPPDWQALGHGGDPTIDPGFDPGIDWADVHGAAHFYLFTLKALAYLRLRRGDLAEADALLDALARLDPHDRVGAAVTRSLLQGAAA